jgi:hypothetical protein
VRYQSASPNISNANRTEPKDKTMPNWLPIRLAATSFAAVALAFSSSAWANQTGVFNSFGGDGNATCLDVQFAGTTPGTRLDSTACNGTNAQKFTINSNWELVANTNTSLCVEGNSQNGAVQLETCNGSASQKWLYFNGALFWAAGESYCLDVFGAGRGNDVTVDLARCNGTVAQIWWPGWFDVIVESTIPTNGGALCLDEASFSSIENVTCTYQDPGPQAWRFTGAGSFGGAISNSHTGGVNYLVSTSPNSGGTGTLLITGQLVDWSLWYISFDLQYGVNFINKGNSFAGNCECLDVLGASNQSGQTVDAYICNGTRAQAWDIWLAAQ